MTVQPTKRTRLVPTSTARFNELPPVPGLEAHHFDLYENELFSHPNKPKDWNYRQKSWWIGRVQKIQNHVGKGPLVEYKDGRDAVHRIRLKQKYLLLNCCPTGMWSIDLTDSAFRQNIQWYWGQIKPAVTDWWWTARFRRNPFIDSREHYGFVFRSETDAILCSQIFADEKPPSP